MWWLVAWSGSVVRGSVVRGSGAAMGDGSGMAMDLVTVQIGMLRV
jgi:hypothetical protein